MTRAVLVGGLAGGAAGGVFAFCAMLLFGSIDRVSSTIVVMAVSSAVIAAVPSAVLGAIAAAVSQTKGARKASRLSALIAGGCGALGALGLVGMAAGNIVVALLLILATVMGGFAVGLASTRAVGSKP